MRPSPCHDAFPSTLIDVSRTATALGPIQLHAGRPLQRSGSWRQPIAALTRPGTYTWRATRTSHAIAAMQAILKDAHRSIIPMR